MINVRLLPSFLALASWLLTLAGPLTCNSYSQTNNPVAKWEKEIQAFELSDKTNPPPAGGILFVGSSSIRKWTTLTRDFAGLPVINRGFGGSEIADSTALAERLIFPYHPRMVLLYAGDNDLASGKSPDHIISDYATFVKKVHQALPEARLIFLSIKPSPSRWKLHEQAQEINRRVAAMKEPYLGFIDVYSGMLGTDGQPRPELYVADKLHMTPQGYELWTALIKPHLPPGKAP